MATLVLSTVGSALFGPVGGAIGALLGQQVDQEIFKPKGREGPRLNDLSLQTSSYGTPLPKVFGTMRVAGTVVWATDLKEDRTREGGGKGRPGTTTYSYSASFAVALSARPIVAVHRIWADGKLLRGAAGDFKSETGFRLLTGGEGQGADPLLAAAEGTGGTPAYRGLALAVFEDFQLADYGNRIPSLTFELEAEAGAVPLDTIVGEISGGAVEAESDALVSGYAAHGDSVRGAIETLLAAMPHRLADDGERLRLLETGGEPAIADQTRLGAAPGEQGGARRTTERQSAASLPDEIAVRYYEPARDYQTGLQRARLGGPGRRSERIDLPATLSADRARAVAEARLERRWAERSTARIALPWREMALRPGDRLTLEDGDWQIAGLELERMALALDLVRARTAPLPVADAADPGRNVGDPDLVHGPTIPVLLDLPALDEALDAQPRLLVAAAGASPGWRHAQLEISIDGGASFEALGPTAPPAIIGATVDALADGDAALIDDVSTLTVDLLHDEMWLEGRSDDALVAGENMALVGDEIVQFGEAVQTGPARFRLSRLLRGRRGTEWASAGHAAGERFVLLDAGTLKRFDLPVAAIGTTAELAARGIGDDPPAFDGLAVTGRSIRPPAPVHLTARRLAGGDISIGWARRSRLGWRWVDGADIPLGEESEAWRLTLTPDIGAVRIVETDAAAHLHTLADQLADGSEVATALTLDIVQLGTLAPSSPPATATITL